MMLIDNTFEFGIPTHISFTLYKFDYIDSIIISRVLRECKNWNISDKNSYTVKVDSFKSALLGSKRLSAEIQRTKIHGLTPIPGLKPNTVTFLWSIIERLPNLTWLTFDISYDKKFTRLIKIENREMLSFYFKINEGLFDLTRVFDRESLDTINKKIIQFGIMPNKYLERSPYFYMKASTLFDVLGQLEMDETLSTFELLDEIDPKLEEDDPILLVITDYTPY
jgi:hypothetical protein